MIRNATPLFLRKRVGPVLALFAYICNVYLNKNRKVPNVLSLEDTVDKILKEKLSVIRFGDGEMSLMENCDLEFQTTNLELASKLKAVLKATDSSLLICVPGFFKKLDHYSSRAFWFILHHLFRYGNVWSELLSFDQVYGDAYLTRPYLSYKDRSKSDQLFTNILSIWKDAKVVLIEGEKSRLGVGNDLFSEVKSLERILCPSENAYSKYDAIKNEALKIDKSKLILISLGPAAKVLAYELFKLGYRVVDVGHIDMEYEMYVRHEEKFVKVRYKYFNEINERNPEDCRDEKYLNQIIARIA